MARFMVPEVSCDTCPERVLADSEEFLSELVDSLSERGWVFRPSEPDIKDLCPRCAACRGWCEDT